jgi:glycosyltransferase involved in cell wall biosynthesis
LKLLIYSHAFAPMIGGVETVVMTLATGLASAGRSDGQRRPDVTVVTATPRAGFNDAALPFRVIRQPSLPYLVSLIRAADVVHLGGPAFLPLLLGFVFRKPLVVEHHGFHTVCPNGQLLHEPTQSPCPGHFMVGRHGECLRCNAGTGRLRTLKLWLSTFPRRWLCRHAQANILPTNWLGELLRLPRSKTVHHGLPDHEPNDLSRSSSLRTTFAFVGRLVSTKGVRTLLQAARQISAEGFKYRLKIIGDGPESELLQQQAASLGLGDSVQFLGYVPPARLESHLAEVATVVMPSLAGEVFGLVAAENMLCGRLLVAADVGALREVIGDAGLLFAPGDSKSLAACLRRVLAEPGLAEDLGKKARQRALDLFGEEQMIAEHFFVYRQLLGRLALSPEADGAVAHPLHLPKG